MNYNLNEKFHKKENMKENVYDLEISHASSSTYQINPISKKRPTYLYRYKMLKLKYWKIIPARVSYITVRRIMFGETKAIDSSYANNISNIFFPLNIRKLTD